MAEQQFRRDVPAQVVLRQESRQHVLLAGFRRVPGIEGGIAQVAPAADEEDLDAGVAPVGRTGHDVQVAPLVADVLLFLHAAQAGDLVADLGGLLVAQLGRDALHLFYPGVDHRPAPALEEHHRVVDIDGVFRGAHVADAGRGAALDLVLQAGPGAVPEEAVLALAHAEQLLQQVQALAHGAAAGVRSEVASLAAPRTPVEREPRKLLVRREVDVGVALVIAQQDVVARPELLDEVVLQQQGLALGVGHRDLDAGDLADQCLRLDAEPGLAEVARHALLQVARLADIEHLAARIQHAIDTRPGGEGLEEIACVEGGCLLGHDVCRSTRSGVTAWQAGCWRDGRCR